MLLLPDELRAAMLEYIGRTLDVRVATSLRDKMSEEQREEFQQFSVLGDTPARLWLERNFPSYIDVMQVAFDNLCTDIRSVAGDILGDEGIEVS